MQFYIYIAMYVLWQQQLAWAMYRFDHKLYVPW